MSVKNDGVISHMLPFFLTQEQGGRLETFFVFRESQIRLGKKKKTAIQCEHSESRKISLFLESLLLVCLSLSNRIIKPMYILKYLCYSTGECILKGVLINFIYCHG